MEQARRLHSSATESSRYGADEAVGDQQAVWLGPNPASHSGYAVKVVGYSQIAVAVLTMILVHSEAYPDEKLDGDWRGSSAWWANASEHGIYKEMES